MSVALAACIALAANHYGVSPGRVEAAIAAEQSSPGVQRLGVAGVPVQWLPYLQQAGFDPSAVATDECTNVVAATWILAYTARIEALVSVATVPDRLPDRAKPWQPIINWVAQRVQISPALLNAVIEQESGFNPYAVSPAGAIGLMQIMPFNAKAWKINPYDPAQNLWAGAWHMKYLLQRYGGNLPLALAAYNAGEGTVAKYGGIPPYKETLNYVPRVIERYEKYAAR